MVILNNIGSRAALKGTYGLQVRPNGIVLGSIRNAFSSVIGAGFTSRGSLCIDPPAGLSIFR
jgi:hypothetical protein